MENKIFDNGVDFTRAIMTGVRDLKEVGTLGQFMVLEGLIAPMLEYLLESSNMVPVDESLTVNVLQHRLEEEDYSIPPEVAAMAIEQQRAVVRLVAEHEEMLKKLIKQDDLVMVIPADTLEEAFAEVKKRLERLGEAEPNAEFVLAMKFAELYDLWCDEELGDLHPALYNMLKMGQDACEVSLSKLDGHELDFDEAWLQREGYEALEAINERLDDLLMQYPEYRDEDDGEAYEGNGDIWGDGPIFPFS